jgi:Protein of unknown function (DUF3891)
MIWRQQGRDVVLILQNDHAQVSGILARKVGNALFAPPSPFESVVRAISKHDCGWAEADQRPEIDSQGLPGHVFEVDILTAIAAWERSVQTVSAGDAYGGLLVSLHTMSLANHAAAKQPPPEDELARQGVFRVRRFVHQQIEIQEQIRGRLEMRTDLPLRGGLAEEGRSPEEDLLRANFFLLEFLDQVSLNLCFGRLVFQRIEMLYPRPGEGAMAARIGGDAQSGMTLNPWPFNCEKLELDIPARRIGPGPYRSQAMLRDACEKAAKDLVRVVLRPAGS